MYDLQHALQNDIDEQQAGGAVDGLVGLTCTPNFNTEPAPPTVVQISIEPNSGAQTKDAAHSDNGSGHSSLDDILVCVISHIDYYLVIFLK